MAKLPQANKDLGQHFLTDQTVIKAITTDYGEECDVIIEVGPGPAVLTSSLAAIGKPFFVIEKDSRFAPALEKYVNSENIHITDALKFNWPKFLTENNLEGKKIWLVSNLPYNVGTVLYTQFLQIDDIKFMSLMFQKEVGEKTYLRNIKNEMNGLLFLSQNYFKSKLLKKVSPGCFTPPPKVDSVVVSYERLEEADITIEDFSNLNKFLRGIFQFKRKQLGSVLKSQFDPALVKACFEKADLPLTIRAEALSYRQLCQIFKSLTEK